MRERLASKLQEALAVSPEIGFQKTLSTIEDIPTLPGAPIEACSELDSTALECAIYTDGACNPSIRRSGAAFAYLQRGVWKTRQFPLGEGQEPLDAEIHGIYQALRFLKRNPVRERCWILTDSQEAIRHIYKECTITPIIADCRSMIREMSNLHGIRWIHGHSNVLGNEAADRAAKQALKYHGCQPASLSYIQKEIRRQWKRKRTPMVKELAGARKALTARILQLKTGHALTAPYLCRIKKQDSVECWWCSEHIQTIYHLLFRCPRWARDRDKFLKSLRKIGILIERLDVDHSMSEIFKERAYPALIEYIRNTKIGLHENQEEVGRDEWLDQWDTQQLSDP